MHYAQFFQELYSVLTQSVSLCPTLRYLSISEKSLKYENRTKLLGVTINGAINFDNHVEQLFKKFWKFCKVFFSGQFNIIIIALKATFLMADSLVQLLSKIINSSI